MNNKNFSRRTFLKGTGLLSVAAIFPNCLGRVSKRPNIILCMSDDQGWGDVGYHNHPHLKTPNLDKMAGRGMKLERFYSGAPVCSPTRGSALTGRHPFRYGIFSANVGRLPKEELTLAEALRSFGYTTGHFGKWHLGTLTKTVTESNRGGERGINHYSPPWENGFDECFSTEAKTPTYDPMIKPDNWDDHRWWNPVAADQKQQDFNTFYWTGPDQMVTENLNGDDSKLIMDRAISFIKNAANEDKPFLSVIWFHAPHWPVVAGKEYRDLYAELDEFSQNHFGCISAMDAQVGELRKSLRDLGIADNTMLWFCSDNGPEGFVNEDAGKSHGKGSAGILRGRKRDLFEGGVRVPGILEWPDKIKPGQVTEFPCSTSDYFPTIMDALNHTPANRPKPVDGISLMPMLNGKMEVRNSSIAFESGKQISLIGDRYKIISIDKGASFMMFDIINDPTELNNIAEKEPELLAKMKRQLTSWQESCKRSLAGKDY
jgi:arylsulfatase A-like enzyme